MEEKEKPRKLEEIIRELEEELGLTDSAEAQKDEV
jgi:hypothetical protein